MGANVKVINLAMKMADLKASIDELGEKKKALQKEYDDLRFNQVPDALDEAGVNSINIKGVGTLYTADDLNVSVPDKQATYEWLSENGFGDIIKPYIFPQTVKAFVKEQINEGNELPDDLFKVSAFTRAVIKSA